ncbi:MAG TPA: sulfotransferase [Actinomycetota bacterium]|jgi:hypothetical protein|nr:sulfotransferase [Actinomycetota bacterium]
MTLREGTEPVHAVRSRVNDTVFILGPARSGTSLLYKVLCMHPQALWLSNWVARFPRNPWLAALNRPTRGFKGARRRVWFGGGANAYVFGRPRPWFERLFPMPVEGEPVYAACGVTQIGEFSAAAMASPAAALRRTVAAVRRASGGAVFVNKRIANNRRIRFLHHAFPDARFVSLVRDGRAVALSLSRVDWWDDSFVWWYGGSPDRWRAEGRDPWEICARNWVEELHEIRDGLRLVPEDQIFRLRYEDLVADPIPILGRLAQFAGLPASSRWRDALRALEFSERDAWKTDLEPDVTARITSIQAEELEAHGYGT